MKKLLAFALALVLLLLLAGCGGKASKSMTYKEFDEKWKRADYAAFLADPSEFVDDLIAVNNQGKLPAESLPFEDWEETYANGSSDDKISASMREKDCVLLNKSIEENVNIVFYNEEHAVKYTLSLMLNSGDFHEDFEFAKALYSCFVSRFGDPTEIEIGDRLSDEPKLLRILDGSEMPQEFTASFGINSIHMFVYDTSFGKSDDSYFSFVSVYVYPEDEED